MIVVTARAIAEREGWPAVTVRRLADAIGYSQPVLYQHFPQGRQQIVSAVARTGFAELARMVSVPGDQPRAEVIVATARAYLRFAGEHTALYQAMFEMPSHTPFASEETPDELRQAFGALVALMRESEDAEVHAELFWSMLHGIATLERDGRLPVAMREARLAAIGQHFG